MYSHEDIVACDANSNKFISNTTISYRTVPTVFERFYLADFLAPVITVQLEYGLFGYNKISVICRLLLCLSLFHRKMASIFHFLYWNKSNYIIWVVHRFSVCILCEQAWKIAFSQILNNLKISHIQMAFLNVQSLCSFLSYLWLRGETCT